MPELESARPRELGDYVHLLKRRWVWVALGMVMGLAGSLAFMETATPTYVSTAKVLVQSTSADVDSEGARTNDELNLDTEAQLVNSVAVARRAGELLGSSLSPVALSGRVTVGVPPNTTVLSIGFSASSAREALRGARAFARAYLENRQEVAQSMVDTQVDRLEVQTDQVTEELKSVAVALSESDPSPSISERALLAARRDVLAGQLAELNSRLAVLQGGLVTPGRQIFDPQLPDHASNPQLRLVLPSGLMLGLLLGLAMAWLRDRRDRRVWSRRELERVHGVRVASELPRPVASRIPAPLVQREHRALFYSMYSARREEEGLVALVVGADVSFAQDEVARGLGHVASKSGARTCHVTHKSLSRDSANFALHAARRLEKAGDFVVADYSERKLVVNGDIHVPRIRAELEALREQKDFVVLDMPTRYRVVDLPVLSRYVDAVVLVVELGRATHTAVAEILTEIDRAGEFELYVVTIAKPGRGRRQRREDRRALEQEAARAPYDPAPGRALGKASSQRRVEQKSS